MEKITAKTITDILKGFEYCDLPGQLRHVKQLDYDEVARHILSELHVQKQQESDAVDYSGLIDTLERASMSLESQANAKGMQNILVPKLNRWIEKLSKIKQ